MRRCKLVLVGWLLCVAGAAVVHSGVFGPGPNSTTIPSTGQSFSIVLTAPPDNSDVGPPGTAPVQGNVSVGSVAGQPIHLLYVLDVSGSTDRDFMTANGVPYVDADGDGIGSFGSPDAGDNFNGDAGDTEAGEVLDGEISGVLALHASIGNPGNVRVGAEAFASNASAADVGPGSGVQVFVTPPQIDANLADGSDIPEVVRTFRSEHSAGGSIGKFTSVPQATLGNNTNFKNALQVVNATLALFPQVPAPTNIVFFLSDGVSNAGARCFEGDCTAELAAAVAAGTKVHTVAVGAGADPVDLQFIADETGGTFTQVDDPSDLATVLPGLTPAGIDHCEVDSVNVSIDGLGNFSTTFTCPGPGPFTITAKCVANDPDSTEVFAEVMVNCTCGNGVVDAGVGEECDPGLPSPPCDATCQRVPVCGDGFLDGAEECDPPGPGCTPSCTLSSCGDSIVDPQAGEECEPPNTPTCDALCQDVICGNGEVDTGEECDDGNTTGGDCCSAICLAEVNGPCDDDNPCTADSCNAQGVCAGNPVADGTPCDDGDVCTLEDLCIAGTCTGGASQEDTDGDGDCDSKEQLCGCDFNDDKEVCLLPNSIIGRPGSHNGEVLVNFFSPDVRKVKIPTDATCANVGECTAGRCTRGKIHDVCLAHADCDQPIPNRCRAIVNWALIPDLSVAYAYIGSKTMPVPAFYPVVPGCSRKVDIDIPDSPRRVTNLKLLSTGTVAGKLRKDRDTLRFYRY